MTEPTPQPTGDARIEPRVGIEVGGTFTDLVWVSAAGALATAKVPSTPQAVHEAVLKVVEVAAIPLQTVGAVVHGSTIATNALLTRHGAQVGLITTAGFRDVIEIGTHDRSGSVYEIAYAKPAVPLRPDMIRELSERIDAHGRVLSPLDPAEAQRAAAELLAQGATAIAICLLHAYRNPAHEQAAAAAIRARFPEASLHLSSEVSPEFREFERTVTTCVNAFAAPVVERYVGRIGEGLSAGGYGGALHIMQSSGGVMRGGEAGRQAVRMLLSGPAAGVRGALWFAARNGVSDVITLDMGGTSTDVAIAPGLVPRSTTEVVIAALPVRTPSIDIVSVGAGGGSIAAIDAGGFLAVGPDSAGADPGPACYGRGGSMATVTDAQVLAGLLRPSRFFGGKMQLDLEAARRAMRDCGAGEDIAATADNILRTTNSAMASAVRLVSTARGIDPRGFTLVAYGGGGPLHEAMVAEDLGIDRVLVPWSPGLASAFGLLVADLTVDLSNTRLHRLDAASLGPERVAELTGLARDETR